MMNTMRGKIRILDCIAVFLSIGAVIVTGGCGEDQECVTCLEPAPVAPTRVYSESGDLRVTLYWDDYAEIYSEIDFYRVWGRAYLGDGDDPDRVFDLIGTVPVGTNYDSDLYQYYFVDDFAGVEGPINGQDWEYAVSAVAMDGQESFLSFELIVDTPLPMSANPLELFDTAGAPGALGTFDFSSLDDGRSSLDDPDAYPDISIVFDNGVPYVQTLRSDVLVQDYGTFVDRHGSLVFSGVSWAPDRGYSSSGRLEVIVGHIYVFKILSDFDPATSETHYAKLGIFDILPPGSGPGSVSVLWAYQIQPGLPELAPPPVPMPIGDSEFTPIRL